MKKRIIIVSAIIALAAVIAIIMISCKGTSTSATTAVLSSSCVSCHTDQAKLQQLTVNYPEKAESAMIKGEC
jgi:hypothetical protein